MTAIDGLLVVVRAVHYGATIVLFGEMVFAFLISGPSASARTLPGVERAQGAADRRFRRVAVVAWLSMVASGACWLALVTVRMSGEFAAAITASAVATVLGSTDFGQAWTARALMALAVALLWQIAHAGTLRRPWVRVLYVGVTGGLLASLAWAGHANADVGGASVIHHTGDAAHLIAAGAWLGGLAPLASLLATLGGSPATHDIDDCAAIAARFGNCAALSVGVLVLTGIVNAYYLVPAPEALLESTYGNVLLAKLLLFSLMLAVAAINRTRLTKILLAKERDDASRRDAARRLKRNVWIEQALAAGVLVLVAVLGVSPPPMRM